MTATVTGRFLPPAKLWLTAGLLVLAGCGAPPSADDTSGDLAAPAPAGATVGADTGSVEEVHEATEATVAADEVTTVASSPSIPLKTALEATDPAQVALGNGTPYLVEFFAFW